MRGRSPAGLGEHAAHAHGPHESNGLITAPLWVLSFFAVFAGLLNCPRQLEKFEHWFEPRVAFLEVEPGDFSASLAVDLGRDRAARHRRRVRLLLAWARPATPRRAQRARPRRASTFLVKKYYLDVLYTDIIVASIKGPIANGVYWFNQHVIDNVLNYTGRGAAALGRVHLRLHRPTRRRRSRQRSRDGHRRSRRRRPRRSRPVGLQFYALAPGRRRWGFSPCSLWIFTLSGGESARWNWFDSGR